jgi:flap endonuclease-1
VLKWTEPNEPELLKFLVERMQFNEERVLGGLKRLKAARGSSSQQRMDSFFKVGMLLFLFLFLLFLLMLSH